MSENKGNQELMHLLTAGLRNADPAPSDISDFAKAVYGWRSIDAELATMAFDSSAAGALSGVRSSVTTRMISFESDNWTVDIEFNAERGRLVGQVEPARRVHLELRTSKGTLEQEADEAGRFAFEGLTSGPVSLVLRLDGETVKTEWTVL